MPRKLDLSIVQSRLDERSDILLLDDYSSARYKNRWKCTICNNEWLSTWNNVIISGSKCPECLRKNRRLDLTGQKFNRLLVIEFSCIKNNSAHWLCRCDCGEEKIIRGADLKNGNTKSCGCHVIENLVDRRFGRLIVIKFSHMNQHSQSQWLCRCDCGNETIVGSNNLKNGTTKSCGCYNKEKTRETHFQDITGQIFGKWTVINFSYKDKLGGSHWLCKCECGEERVVAGSGLKNGRSKSCGCWNREKASERMSGENHPNWRGGVFGEYTSEWTNELKESIRNRDNHKCQYLDCIYDNMKDVEKLSVHHIDGNKQNCQEYNLISLCRQHHMIVERNNPELWQDYFYQITRDYLIER